MQRSAALVGVFALWVCPACAQTPSTPPPNPSVTKTSAPVGRPRIAAAAQRNENVAVQQIDTNAAKESNIRIGTRATASQFAALDSSYYAAEHGQPASEPLALPVIAPRVGWHRGSFLESPEQRLQCTNVLPGRTGPAIAAQFVWVPGNSGCRTTRVHHIERISAEDTRHGQRQRAGAAGERTHADG